MIAETMRFFIDILLAGPTGPYPGGAVLSCNEQFTTCRAALQQRFGVLIAAFFTELFPH
ncbi:MAG: hypothetical protein J5772_08410 [Clostridia bacterium]|nr:hypothetical protein [Clostridia bacterium]